MNFSVTLFAATVVDVVAAGVEVVGAEVVTLLTVGRTVVDELADELEGAVVELVELLELFTVVVV